MQPLPIWFLVGLVTIAEKRSLRSLTLGVTDSEAIDVGTLEFCFIFQKISTNCVTVQKGITYGGIYRKIAGAYLCTLLWQDSLTTELEKKFIVLCMSARLILFVRHKRNLCQIKKKRAVMASDKVAATPTVSAKMIKPVAV